MNKEKLAQFRNRLVTDLESTKAIAERARTMVSESSETIPNFLQDESGAAQGGRDLQNAISVHLHCEVQESLLTSALARMDLGQFGICRDCSLEIDDRRLSAVPSAACCIHCQQESELKIVTAPLASKTDRRMLSRFSAQAS